MFDIPGRNFGSPYAKAHDWWPPPYSSEYDHM